MDSEAIYRVTFLQQGEVYEMFARSVGQGGLLGFIEVEGVLFGERSSIVVDPSEERLKTEFEGVTRFYLPMHSVVRIDQVERQGVNRITAPAKDGASVTPFPVPMYKPTGDSGGS